MAAFLKANPIIIQAIITPTTFLLQEAHLEEELGVVAAVDPLRSPTLHIIAI